MATKEELLRHYYGYTSFRKGQIPVIESILNGQDTLAVMPTSAGKSICYQIPALMMTGVTIVISPLISLMQDQVAALETMGIPAILMNSSQSFDDYQLARELLRSQRVKMVYVAPERLLNAQFIQLLEQVEVSMIAVDEAHCISQWGNDFRPAYQQIIQLLPHLSQRPIIAAFTATATERVREDIQHYLQMVRPFELVTGFDRPNLFFALEEPEHKKERLLQLLATKEPTIIYCSTRKQVMEVTEFLQKHHIAARAYHAGLSIAERQQTQQEFLYDRIRVMVATNAFGMGIDKSNVRHVIHYNMPKDIESYYQEAGRAGRDGEAAVCTLLFTPRDIMTNVYLLEQGADPAGKQKLNVMIDYCRTTRCLRQTMLHYFGEKQSWSNCGNCTNCTHTVETTDITIEAQKILSCIYRMQQRFGMTKVIEVLRGSHKKELNQWGFEQLSTFGIMKEYNEATLRKLISALVAEHYILIEAGDYPILTLSQEALKVLKNQQKVIIKQSLALSIAKATSPSARGNESHQAYDRELFERLKQVRYDIAQSIGKPPFVIFSDATLKAFCRHYPQNELEFLQISGVGQKKLEAYGTLFIAAIVKFLEEQQTTET